jgi:hypothetical protein
MRVLTKKCLLVPILLFLQISTCIADQKPAPKQDPVAKAEVALTMKRYHVAAEMLSTYIEASVGDPKDRARDLLEKAYTGLAAEQSQQGNAIGAAKTDLEHAAFAGSGKDADRLKADAKKELQTAYRAAVTAHDGEAASHICSAWTDLFPNDPAIASPEDVMQFRLDAAEALAKHQTATEILYWRILQLLQDGATPHALQEKHLDHTPLAYARLLLDRYDYVDAAAVLNAQPFELDDAAKKQATALRVEAMFGSADAWAALGDAPNLSKALDACETEPACVSDRRRMSNLRASLSNLGPSAEPQLVERDKPIKGDGEWNSAGRALKVKGNLDLRKAKITVRPGTVIEGPGNISVADGQLHFAGTPHKPIVVRGVHFTSIDLNAGFNAEWTLFEDCTFSKGGAWFWNGGYTTKWNFTDCMFHRSTFSSLSRGDYGVRMARLTFVECNLPARPLCSDPVDDAARRYNDDQNAVTDCDFFRCQLPPSFLWMTKKANLQLCKITSNDLFNSTKDLPVTMFVPIEDSDFPMQLISHSFDGYSGAVIYRLAAREFPRGPVTPLWAFISATEAGNAGKQP